MNIKKKLFLLQNL